MGSDASWLGGRGKVVDHGILDGRVGFDGDGVGPQPPRQTVTTGRARDGCPPGYLKTLAGIFRLIRRSHHQYRV